MFAKLQAFLERFVGPNAAHVLDGLVAFELTAAGAALSTDSARNYAVHHPAVAVTFTLAPPVLTALASKFRKAAHAKTPPAP
jgi:hypothetical protein